MTVKALLGELAQSRASRQPPPLAAVNPIALWPTPPTVPANVSSTLFLPDDLLADPRTSGSLVEQTLAAAATMTSPPWSGDGAGSSPNTWAQLMEDGNAGDAVGGGVDDLGKFLGSIGQPTEVPLWADDAERDELLENFFEYSTRQVLQLVHERCFFHQLRTSPLTPPHQGLLLAMCATGAVVTHRGFQPPLVTTVPATHAGAPYRVANRQSSCKDPRVRDALAARLADAAVLAIDLEKPRLDDVRALLILILLDPMLPRAGSAGCGGVFGNERDREWLLTGAVVRASRLARLDVDPDELERDGSGGERDHGRRLTWVEKEARRRAFAAACMMDEVDMIFREACFGLWKGKESVKPPAPTRVWMSVDPVSGEPGIVDDGSSHPDPVTLSLQGINLRSRVAELNWNLGLGYSALHENLASGAGDSLILDSGWIDRGAPARLEVYDASSHFEALSAEIDAWHATWGPGVHPASLANDVVFTLTYDTAFLPAASAPSPQPPPFSSLKIHMFYFMSTIALHRARVLRELGTTSSTDKQLSTGCRESVRRCAEASVGITALLRRPVSAVVPDRRGARGPAASPPRAKAFAFCLHLSAGYAVPLLEAGLLNAVFLVILGVGAHARGLGVDADAGKRKAMRDMVAGIVGETFKVAAIEGLAAVMQILAALARRRDGVGGMLAMLERVVNEMGLEECLRDVPKLLADADLPS
ncbi:hypothetical protein HK101_000648 [Irineochytrium annulatum]|nr:hypothetical protein HK101_000648 [Irineochytrium annulatum]